MCDDHGTMYQSSYYEVLTESLSPIFFNLSVFLWNLTWDQLFYNREKRQLVYTFHNRHIDCGFWNKLTTVCKRPMIKTTIGWITEWFGLTLVLHILGWVVLYLSKQIILHEIYDMNSYQLRYNWVIMYSRGNTLGYGSLLLMVQTRW